MSFKNGLNAVLARFGVRLVNAQWGPRGHMSALEAARRAGFNPKQIIDVGASDGSWTRECMTLFPTSRYLLAEPLKDRIETLSRLAASCSNVDIYNGALSSTSGTMTIHVHGDQSSLLESKAFPTDTSYEIPVEMLDNLLSSGRILPPDFIKADVQGYELDVLEGARKSLESTELILLEVSFRQLYERAPLAHEVIARVGELGFRIFDVCTYAQRQSDQRLLQSDILFGRIGSKLFANESWSS